MSEQAFGDFINILADIQLSLAAIIAFEFFCRKLPPILGQIKEELDNRTSQRNRRRLLIKEFFIRTVFNFEIIYYIGYIVFAALGRFMDQFFFAFLLLEVFTRVKTLKNVIMSVRKPIKELLLTFLLWVILVYYFSILLYSFFRADIPTKYSNDCETLFRCVINVFYQNNKVILLNSE
jgi:hypothetical protein